MSLRIRLARGGAKKRPFYRIVVADIRSPRDGRFIEKIGFFDPMVAKDHPDRLRLDAERAKHWLSVGAKPSDKVHRFLAAMELMPAREVPTQTKKDKPRPKTLERLAAAAEAKKAAADEAAKAPAAAPAEEAPVEEAAAEEAPAEAAPAVEAPAQEAPAEEAPATEAPAEEAAAEEAPAEVAPAEEAPAEEAPAEEAAPAEAEAEKPA